MSKRALAVGAAAVFGAGPVDEDDVGVVDRLTGVLIGHHPGHLRDGGRLVRTLQADVERLAFPGAELDLRVAVLALAGG